MKIMARLMVLTLCLVIHGSGYALTMRNELKYTPADCDIFLGVDMGRVYSFLTRRGVQADEIPLMLGDLESQHLAKMLSAFKIRAVEIQEIVFTGTSSAIKQNSGFLIFIKTLKPLTIPGEIQAAGERISDSMVYTVPEETGIYFALTGNVCIIASKQDLGSYFELKKKGTLVKNQGMDKFMQASGDKALYGRLNVSQSMRDMMRMGMSMAGPRAKGFEKNPFVNAVMNLKSVEYGVATDRDMTITCGWEADRPENGDRLVMISHFAIVASSLAVSFLDDGTGKQADGKTLEKVQALIGRIGPSRTDNGVMFNVTLNKDECQEIADAAKAQIAKTKESMKERELAGRVSVLVEKIREGDRAAAKKLIDQKVPLNKTSSDGTLPLVAACESGNQNMVEFLVSQGADVNAVSSDGTSPVVAATASGPVTLVKFLLGRGADVQAVNFSGENALHKAASRGDVNILNLLLEKEIDLNAVTSEGSSALHLAALNGHLEAVKILVARGVDPMIEDYDGLRASGRAREKGHEAIVNFLLEHEKTGDEENPELNRETPAQEEPSAE